MSESAYTNALFLAVGTLLALAVLIVWRRGPRALVRLLVLQGAAVAALPILIGGHTGDGVLAGVGVAVLLLRGAALPWLLARSLPAGAPADDHDSLINATASLLSAAALTAFAYVVSQPILALDPSPATRATPVALAVVFIGFFLLVTRRHAHAQIVGFLVLDNGIAAFAFLLTAGFPLVVELGSAIDVLLAVLILQVLSARMHAKFGGMDLDQLRQLRD